MADNLISALKAATDWTEALIRIPSVTPGEQDILQWLEHWCHQRGMSVLKQEVSGDRWNLIAWKDNPRLWFSTHVDTVPPYLPFRREGDTLHGRGACDTHGGLACMLSVLDDLPRGCGLLIVVGEEVDHCGARKIAGEDLLPGSISDRTIVLCEPTRMKMARAQKGVLKVLLKSRGVAAHSSLPELGQSAILPLLEATNVLLNTDWPRDDVLGETLLNLGVIQGGNAANVIPAAAQAEFCFRTVRDQGWYERKLEVLLSPDLSWDFEGAGDPQIFDALPGWPTYVAPYGTDAAYLKKLGRLLLIGPGRIEVAHSLEEQISLAELKQGIQGYRRIAEEILGEPLWS